MVPIPLHLSCTSCGSELAVEKPVPGQILEGPCPYCNDHQRFQVPLMRPAPAPTTNPEPSPKKAERKSKHTIVDIVSIAAIVGLLIAIAGTAWAKFSL